LAGHQTSGTAGGPDSSASSLSGSSTREAHSARSRRVVVAISDFGRQAVWLGRRIRGDGWTQLVILSFLAYVAYWSYLSVAKFYALTAAVFDLGLSMQQLWNFTQIGSTAPLYYLQSALYSPLAFVLSPLALFDSYPLLLVFQTVALGSAAFPIYFIAKRELASRPPAFALSTAYLLYFPLAGVNWFDFHFEALFVPLFLFGYACLTARWYKLALLLLFFAGSSWYPYIILIGLFSFLLIIEAVVRWRMLDERISKGHFRFAVTLFVLSALFFAFQYLTYSAPMHTGPSFLIDNRVIVLSLTLIPVLMLPLFSPRWLLMLAPFAYLELTSTCGCFSYPAIFQLQYSTLFIPFVFLGTIGTLAWIGRIFEDRRPELYRRTSNESGFHLRPEVSPKVILAETVLLVTLLFAAIYQPYGPLNGSSSTSFDASQATEINWTTYNHLEALTQLIPRDTPYVLFQNDMPELLPRPLAYEQTPLITSLYDWLNLSNYDAAQNSFPLELTSGQVVGARIDYAIDNPYSNPYAYGFFDTGTLPNVSMYYFARTLYGSGYYGIAGEEGGLTVFERGYDSPPELYEPYSAYFPATQLIDSATTRPSTQSNISSTNPAPNQSVWYGPYATLSPGLYSINLSLLTTNNSPSNRMFVYATWDLGRILFGNGSLFFNGTDFPRTNTWTTVHMEIYLNNTYTGVQFAGYPLSWSGEIAIRSIQITQLAPGAPVFTPSLPDGTSDAE
jgi:uncharacterized membrane protein